MSFFQHEFCCFHRLSNAVCCFLRNWHSTFFSGPSVDLQHGIFDHVAIASSKSPYDHFGRTSAAFSWKDWNQHSNIKNTIGIFYNVFVSSLLINIILLYFSQSTWKRGPYFHSPYSCGELQGPSQQAGKRKRIIPFHQWESCSKENKNICLKSCRRTWTLTIRLLFLLIYFLVLSGSLGTFQVT